MLNQVTRQSWFAGPHTKFELILSDIDNHNDHYHDNDHDQDNDDGNEQDNNQDNDQDNDDDNSKDNSMVKVVFKQCKQCLSGV
jgi:hypothetical protein